MDAYMLQTLRQRLTDWYDFDQAAYHLGVCIGIIEETQDFTSTKHIFWTDNVIGSLLHYILEQLVNSDILEMNEDQQYRWKSQNRSTKHHRNKTLDNTLHKNYLLDLGLLVKEEARKAKQIRDAQDGIADYAYHSGYAMAMHHIVALMQHQADIFDISRQDLQLDDIDPDQELL